MTQDPPSADAVVAVVATDETAGVWRDAFAAAGLVAVAVPFATVVPPPDPAALRAALGATTDLVIATSANATRFLPRDAGHGRRAAAVGARTAASLAAAGFEVVTTGEQGAEALARVLVTAYPPCRVLWLRGARATEAGAEALRAADFTVTEAVAYATADAPAFPAAVAALRGRRVVWVVGSGAAAEALVRAGGGRVTGPCVAAGPSAASALRTAGAVVAATAARPVHELLVAAVRALRR